MTPDLFGGDNQTPEALAPGAFLLRGFAIADERTLVTTIQQLSELAPFRQMVTPGGYTMSVAMSGCGDVSWVTDLGGYRYQPSDPLTDAPWPDMPEVFRRLAERAAEAAGFHGFRPDACLINRYAPGARMSLHQDKDECDFSQPIVSVSLGVPATFQFGGQRRNEKPLNLALQHGDVVVWGGPARLSYHGVLRLKQGWHPLTGQYRYNLTFRKAL